jgi:hypothetical protein
MASSPFSYGMLKFTSQFSNGILIVVPNDSIGLGGTTPPYTPFSFGSSQIPQTTPNMGGIHAFNPGSNPLTFGWNNQLGGQDSTQVSSYTPTSLELILTNMFGMMNPPLSYGFTCGGGHFHALGNPQPRSNPARGKFYNPHQNIPTGMMPNQTFMNQTKGGSYNPGQGHGTYQNPGWAAVPQTKYFQGAWG